jgi:peptide/nickel transport system substrate-binding protein
LEVISLKKTVSALLAVILLMSTVLLGCEDTAKPADQATQDSTTEPVKEEKPKEEKSGDASVSTVVKLKQAPMLDGKNLPAVEDRLPKDPKIANQIPAKHLKDGKLEIGRYGGTLRMVNPSPEWNPDIFLMLNEPLLNTPGSSGEEVTPNILKDFHMSPDGKIFTFVMREGMKWSDGHPVTTEDVKFAVEDVMLNEELSPVFPQWLKPGAKRDGEPMKFEVIDDYTFKISFTEAYGRFPIQLALTGWRGYTDLLKPAHYLKQFHIKYTKLENLEPLIKEAGFQPGEWMNLFNDKDIINWELTNKKAIGFPVLYPWIMVSSTDTVKLYERNPYFWKIDMAGNQFPYIDGIRSEHVQDVEMMSTQVLSGGVDLMRESAALNKMPLYKEYEARGGYSAPLLNMHVDPTSIFLNLTYDDDNWRKVVRDVRFRQALNMAINREEIIDAVYFGFAELPQLVPSEYNPQRANELLNEMGLDKRDKNGWRIGPDGKPFEIPFETGAHAPDMVPVLELVTEMWKEVGIKTTMKTIDSALWGTRNAANELQASIMWNVQPMWRSGGWTDFTPNLDGRLWGLWFTSDGKEGEVPPADVKRLFTLSQAIMGVYPGTPEDQKLYEEIYGIHYDNVFQMPIAEKVKQPLIVNAKLGNVPIDGTAVAANIAGVQMFFRE